MPSTNKPTIHGVFQAISAIKDMNKLLFYIKKMVFFYAHQLQDNSHFAGLLTSR